MQDMCKHAAYIYKNQSIYHLPKVVFIFIAPSLPWKEGRFLTDKCYKAAALSTRAHSTSSVLMAHQAELEEDMTAKPDTSVWEELCIFTDHVLCRSRSRHAGSGSPSSQLRKKEELLVKEFLVDKINVSGAVVRRTDKEMEMRCEEEREMLRL